MAQSCQFLVGSTLTLSTRAFDDVGTQIPAASYTLRIRTSDRVQTTVAGTSFTYNASTLRYTYNYIPMAAGPMQFRFDSALTPDNPANETTILIAPTVFAL